MVFIIIMLCLTVGLSYKIEEEKQGANNLSESALTAVQEKNQGGTSSSTNVSTSKRMDFISGGAGQTTKMELEKDSKEQGKAQKVFENTSSSSSETPTVPIPQLPKIDRKRLSAISKKQLKLILGNENLDLEARYKLLRNLYKSENKLRGAGGRWPVAGGSSSDVKRAIKKEDKKSKNYNKTSRKAKKF
jgi:hypothetical protein